VSRRHLLPTLGLLGIAVVTALGVVLVSAYAVGGSNSEQSARRPAPRTDDVAEDVQTDLLAENGIDASGTIEPRIVLFGDTIEARVDVVVDPTRIDPGSVRVAAAFSPWEIVDAPRRTRIDSDTMSHLRTTYVLRCLSVLCLSPGQSTQTVFPSTRMTFSTTRRAGRPAQTRTARINWPVMTVFSRYSTSSFEGRQGLVTPWHADLLTFPALSLRLPWGLLLVVLVGSGLLLLVAGGTLVYAAWPRRAVAPPPEPEEPPPPPLSPLEQALALLEDAARSNGAEQRRRSLELVAEVLEEWGDTELARAARDLAWSESNPAVEQTSHLATRVRESLALEELVREETADDQRGGNGRVA
jgi:hypothetical protein